jgi:uncharacterized protein YdhG (YjbR/CyaY superfamily)
MKAYKTVDAYLKDLSDEQREPLAKVRATIKAAVPSAAESISYGMPAYKYNGKPLIYYGAAKNHVAIYGAVPAAMDPKDLAPYETSKGTIKFPPGKAIPASLVKKLLKARIAEIDAAAAKPKSAAKKKASAAKR